MHLQERTQNKYSLSVLRDIQDDSTTGEVNSNTNRVTKKINPNDDIGNFSSAERHHANGQFGMAHDFAISIFNFNIQRKKALNEMRQIVLHQDTEICGLQLSQINKTHFYLRYLAGC